ncbi:hypothetical protein FIU86_03395 [Roseovarius sp. THAF9]|uniref:hypothetical protein n=1 Tax=Roseovarius sp. THAF9 TaxID=2587847 RepID=UPI00126852A6|nr:hypothetical protein [Roseovarius sp. THAF9]QFT91872.1 hypothetical protein FIU86_03395 [Roseovarius sp. THAF9]
MDRCWPTASGCGEPVRVWQGIALAALCVPRAALADLTVEEAWGVWTTQFEALGLDWEADVVPEGDALAVGPIFLSMQFPGLPLEMTLQLPGPRFVPDAGEIVVQLPTSEAMPFSVATTGDAEDGFSSSGAFAWRMEDVSVRMRQTDAGIETRWSGENFEIDMTEYGIGGQPFPAEYRYVQSGFDITQISRIDDAWLDFTRRGVAGQVVIDYGYGDQSSPEGLAGTLRRDEVETLTELRLARGGPTLDRLPELAEAGMMFRHEAAAKSGFDEDDEWYAGEQIASSETRWTNITGLFTLKGDGLGVVSGADAAEMQMTDELLGISVDVEAARILLDLAMPVLRAVEPQDYALRFELDGLTLSEETWTAFFMSDALPRQTADLKVDLGGEAILLETLFDLAALGQSFNGPLPVSIETLDLRALDARFWDAELAGKGAVRFDHSAPQAFDGFPATEGDATFELIGVQGLLDRLTEAGVLTIDDAMSARMMMGMFTAPVDGEDDAVRAEVELFGDGQVVVNGQRLR